MSNTFTHLASVIDTLAAEGKTAKVTKLPSVSKGYRKSAWCKQAKAPRQKVYAWCTRIEGSGSLFANRLNCLVCVTFSLSCVTTVLGVSVWPLIHIGGLSVSNSPGCQWHWRSHITFIYHTFIMHFVRCSCLLTRRLQWVSVTSGTNFTADAVTIARYGRVAHSN